jgi:hypothetical protein
MAHAIPIRRGVRSTNAIQSTRRCALSTLECAHRQSTIMVRAFEVDFVGCILTAPKGRLVWSRG